MVLPWRKFGDVARAMTWWDPEQNIWEVKQDNECRVFDIFSS